MILRSGKALIKTSIHSSPYVNEDMISNKLPEELLINILTLLPEPLDAIRTCVLSKRWKHLWVFLPDLHFVLPKSFQSAEQVKTFHDSVDNALALRGGMLVRRFFLCCPVLDYDNDRVLNLLISIAAQSKLEILELKFPIINKLRLSWDLFKACSTLVELTLKGVCMLDVPQDEFLFPCLKKVKLTSVDYLGDQSPQHLISCCPVLQELCLELQIFLFTSKKKKIIYSQYLKRLSIQDCKFGCEILIDAPTLECLYIEDYSRTKYSVRNPLSLVEAHIINRFCDTVAELLTCVSAATRLTLAYQSLLAIYGFRNQNVPMFPNLVKLDVHIHSNWSLWSVLFNLLHKMPLLEQFTISYGHLREHHISQITPAEAPNCLRFTVKEIIILNEGAITQKQFILIEYLLRHSTILERLTLKAHNADHETREQLLNFHRGSNMCQIELV